MSAHKEVENLLFSTQQIIVLVTHDRKTNGTSSKLVHFICPKLFIKGRKHGQACLNYCIDYNDITTIFKNMHETILIVGTSK